MELYWAGKDITKYVTITGCVHRDASRGKSDSLELRLANASIWYRWGPEEDDEIRVLDGEYDTGRMYLNTVIPEGDDYRVLATATRREAVRKAWKTYRETTIGKIFESCGLESGMDGKLYGISGSIEYPYILRENEGTGAFLSRIGRMEGMAVKAFGGCYRGIYIPWAQNMDIVTGFTIHGTETDGIIYRRRSARKYTSLTVRTPWAEATARDGDAAGNNPKIITSLPAMDAVTAG